MGSEVAQKSKQKDSSDPNAWFFGGVEKKPGDANPKKQPGEIRSPGGIKTQAEIVIHSRLAHSCFYGRKRTSEKYGITGLLQFSHNMRYIWDMAAADDPYADAKLLEIEKALDDAFEIIARDTKYVDTLLGGMGSISITSDESDSPIKLPLSFRTPYGFMAARLLADFDSLIMKIISASHVGLLWGDDRHKLENNSGKKLRNAFAMSAFFKASGTTRDDFAANNARAREAIERFGKVDEDILSGKHRAKVSPKVSNQIVRDQFDQKHSDEIKEGAE